MGDDADADKSVKPFEISGNAFYVGPLIERVPQEYDYSSFEYYEQHIYLGTVSGVLLHYFELDPGNFTLLSEVQFDDARPSRIDQIKILPEIDRALVLSDRKLRLFLLPEFAPASNVPSVLNTTDFSVLEYDEAAKAYSCYLYTKNLIKKASITDNEIKVEEKFQIKAVETALPIIDTDKLMAAVDNSYSVIDLKNARCSALFKVCESEDARLPAMVTRYSDHEFMVTCGVSANETCMGLILNDSGDITRGTIVLDDYPSAIMVDDPFVISESNNSKTVKVHLIIENEEPRVVQTIASHACVHLSETSQPFVIRQFDKELRDKLRYVPLVGAEISFREDQERSFVERNVVIYGQIVIFGQQGIYSFQQRPRLLTIDSYDEKTLPILKSIVTTEGKTPYQKLEVKYFRILYAVMLLLHGDSVDTTLIDQWLRFYREVDIRILIYLLDFTVYGDLWIPNGLLGIVKKLHSLKLIHKCSDISQLIKYTKAQLKEKSEDSLEDGVNVYLSLDMILLRENIKTDTVDLSSYDVTSLKEASKVLSVQKQDYSDVLLHIYSVTNNAVMTLSILRQKDKKRLIEFLVNHANDLSEDYIQHEMLNDISWALSDYDDNVASDVLKLLDKVNVDSTKLISIIENPATKIQLLEKLGANGTEDLNFMYEYYKLKLSSLYDKILCHINAIIEEFVSDMNYDKPSLEEYLSARLQNNYAYTECKEMSKKLLEIEQTLDGMGDSFIDEIDATYVLRLMILNRADVEKKIGLSKLTDLYLSWNDFKNVESLLTGNEAIILKVVDHYLSLKDILVLQRFLVRNICSTSNLDLFVTVLEKLPSDVYVSVLGEVIFPMLRKTNECHHRTEIEKSILRRRSQTIKRIDQFPEL